MYLDKLFTLRVRVPGEWCKGCKKCNNTGYIHYGSATNRPMLSVRCQSKDMVVIHAFDENYTDNTGHSRVSVVVRQGGKTIFEHGKLWCGIPMGQSLDGKFAKECVLSLVGMQEGDTDEDYFADYTEEQLAWANKYGEELSMIREFRYCDENGNLKGR